MLLVLSFFFNIEILQYAMQLKHYGVCIYSMQIKIIINVTSLYHCDIHLSVTVTSISVTVTSISVTVTSISLSL